ncbi:phage tail tape measure protein [Leifsonia aquatica]|uniref:hypothetical protein n=1 Tax=Leifsonia aquatica TaxID=144185 RepID=UPI003810B91E
MAGRTAILSVRIVSDAKDGQRGMDETASAADRLGSRLDNLTIPAAAAVAAITKLGLDAGRAASDLQQSQGAVGSVFGDTAGAVEDFASRSATSVGLASSSYQQMASVIGSQLKNMGVPMGDAAAQTNDLINLGADLAATFGGETSDAVDALSSLLRGERDPIERYGVSMNQAAIDAQKAAMGLSGLTGEADKNATLQATLALLTKQTADAQGQFARETDSAAGAQQIANARWEDAQAKLGTALLPVMTKAAQLASDFAGGLSENSEATTILVGVIGGLAAGVLALNAALRIYQAVQAVATAATWASNAAWLANPITWIILAIVAAVALVIAIVVLLVQHWDEVQKVAGDVWGFVVEQVQNVGDWFGSVFGAIGDWWNGLVDDWTRGFETFVGWIRTALDWLGQLIDGAVPGWVKDMLGMNSFAGGTARAAAPAASNARMAVAFAAAVPFAAASSTMPARIGGAGSPFAAGGGGTTYNIEANFNGVTTDPEGVVRDLRKLMDDSDKANGRTVAAGGSKR